MGRLSPRYERIDRSYSRSVVGMLIVLLAGPLLPQDKPLPIRLQKTLEFSIGGGRVWGVDFSPDGRLMASGGEQGDLVLQEYKSGKVLWRRPVSDHWIGIVRFSPNGKYVAAAGRSMTVWDVESGTRIREFKTTTLKALAFHPDGSRLAFNSNGHLMVVSTSDWRPVTTFDKKPRLSPQSLVFDPEGGSLIVGGGASKVWSIDGDFSDPSDPSDPRLLYKLSGKSNDVLAIGYTGDVLIVAGGSGEVRFGSVRVQLPKSLYSVAVARTGDRVATGCANGDVVVWSSQGRELARVKTGAAATGLRFRPDGKSLLIADYDGRFFEWDLRNIRERPNPHPSGPDYIGFCRDSSCVVASGMRTVFADLRTGVTRTLPIRTPIGPGRKDREVFLIANEKLEIRDARTTDRIKAFELSPLFFRSEALSLSPNRRSLFFNNESHDLVGGGVVKLGIVGRTLDVAWSKRGDLAVATVLGIEGDLGTLYVFDGKRRVVLEKESKNAVMSVSFSPAGQHLVYTTGEGMPWQRRDVPIVYRVDMTSMKPVANVAAEVYWCRHVDDKLLLVHRAGVVANLLPTQIANPFPTQGVETLELWNAADLSRLGTLPLDVKRIRHLSLSPDRQVLAVAGVSKVCVYQLRRR